jgi:hypothetical protein
MSLIDAAGLRAVGAASRIKLPLSTARTILCLRSADIGAGTVAIRAASTSTVKS